MRCPVCGGRVERTALRLTAPFRCQWCSAELECGKSYGRSRAVVGISLGAALAKFLRVGWPLFPFVALAACTLLARPIMALSLRYFPPRLRPRVGPGLGLGK